MGSLEQERHDSEIAEWQKLQRIRAEHPELFVRDQLALYLRILTFLGMHALPTDLPVGYIRRYPEDFIVEEVTRDGNVHTIEPEEDPQAPQGQDRRTLYCDVVKRGIGTADMQWRIAEAAGLERDQVQYGGLKDEVAITSQLISLRKVRYEQVNGLAIPGIFLKHCFYGKDIIRVGSHESNEFTILVRTQQDIDHEQLSAAVGIMGKEGFLNYYGQQRFGFRPHRLGGRHANHVLGKYILQGRYEEAVKSFFTGTNDGEIPLFAQIRRQAAQHYGAWPKLLEIFSQFPINYERELVLVAHLLQNPNDFVGALQALESQAKMWVHAYVSFCFNTLLSSLSKQGTLPTLLPLPISPAREDQEPYARLFQEHKTTGFLKWIKPFPSIAVARRHVPTRVVPAIYRVAPVSRGVIFHFRLGKGSYATTMLMNLFTLLTDEPIPDWVSSEQIDVKATIGTGSVQRARNALRVSEQKE